MWVGVCWCVRVAGPMWGQCNAAEWGLGWAGWGQGVPNYHAPGVASEEALAVAVHGEPSPPIAQACSRQPQSPPNPCPAPHAPSRSQHPYRTCLSLGNILTLNTLSQALLSPW